MKRNMKQSITSVLSMVIMLLSFAACSGETLTSDVPTISETPVSIEQNEQTEQTEQNEIMDLSQQEPYTAYIVFYGDSKSADTEAVSKALSEITKAKLNTTVEITCIGYGSIEEQLNLMLASGEPLDIFPTGSAKHAANGQIIPLDDLLQTAGKETYDQISSSDWAGVTFDGNIYCVPTNGEKASGKGLVMNKDICDELEIDYENIKDYDGIYEMLVKVRDAYPNVYPLVSNYGGMNIQHPVDSLGDNFGVLLDPYNSDALIVEDLYSSDYYRELCETMYQWAQEGLIMSDADTNTEAGKSLLGAGRGFARFTSLKPGFEAEQSAAIGIDLVTSSYAEPLSTTISSGWSIAVNSKDPTRSMQVINLLYTDPEASSIAINGVQGVHWDFVDEGKGIIDYPEGVDSSNVGYIRVAWGWPNQQISYIWNGASENLWSDLKEFNETAAISPAKGFSFDNSNVVNEIAACKNVTNKYCAALECGTLDPAEALPQFLKELEANGIDRIIDEKQRQLDEWAANR